MTAILIVIFGCLASYCGLELALAFGGPSLVYVLTGTSPGGFVGFGGIGIALFVGFVWLCEKLGIEP